ncbi:7798_t:CDS:2 [Funneliformis geosporum]|nr:7798_t:CDS:2 [Funneliformis geosporum]
MIIEKETASMIVLRGTKPPEIQKRAIIFEELVKEKLESW